MHSCNTFVSLRTSASFSYMGHLQKDAARQNKRGGITIHRTGEINHRSCRPPRISPLSMAVETLPSTSLPAESRIGYGPDSSGPYPIRSAEGRRGARRAQRPEFRLPPSPKTPASPFLNPEPCSLTPVPCSSTPVFLSSPSTPKNHPNSHQLNHINPKNSWHSSFPPTRTIKVRGKVPFKLWKSNRIPASITQMF